MKILFWNTHNNENINFYLKSIIDENQIDFVVLAEYNSGCEDLCKYSFYNNKHLIEYMTIGCDRIRLFGFYDRDLIEPASQNKYYTVQIIKEKYILCGLHLPSDLQSEKEEERGIIIRSIMHDIHET